MCLSVLMAGMARRGVESLFLSVKSSAENDAMLKSHWKNADRATLRVWVTTQFPIEKRLGGLDQGDADVGCEDQIAVVLRHRSKLKNSFYILIFDVLHPTETAMGDLHLTTSLKYYLMKPSWWKLVLFMVSLNYSKITLFITTRHFFYQGGAHRKKMQHVQWISYIRWYIISVIMKYINS